MLALPCGCCGESVPQSFVKLPYCKTSVVVAVGWLHAFLQLLAIVFCSLFFVWHALLAVVQDLSAQAGSSLRAVLSFKGQRGAVCFASF